MGIFTKKENRENILDESKCDDVLLRAYLNGFEVHREDALAIPMVSSSVDFICNTFAQIPFKLYKESTKDGKKVTEEVKDDRVSIINDDTRDKLDGFQFKKAICEDYLLGKGGYAYIDKSGNKFNGLYYVNCDRVQITKNEKAIKKDFTIMVDAETFKDFQFIKLLRNTKDGASGKGLTEEIGKALQTAFKRLCYDYDLTVTGGSRKGFIKSQKHLDKASIDALKKAWESYYSGNANTVILNDGLEFQEASNTSKENETNAKETTFNEVIKNIFHIGTTYEETIKNAIMPIATAFCTALNRDFLLEKEKSSFYFAPDTKELMKGSLTERYNAYQIAIKNGFKTRNEIRYMEDDDALEGLDMMTLGLGEVLLDTKTGYIYTPNTNTLVKMGENPEQAPMDEMGGEENTESLDDIEDTEVDDAISELINEFAPELAEEDDEERAYSSQYYDPVKAHEYYEKNKKLKGRKSTAGLNDKGKAAAKYIKQKLTEMRKSAVEKYKAEMNKKISDLREKLKAMSKTERKRRKAEIYEQIKSLRADNKQKKADLKTEFDNKYLNELDKIKNDKGMQS